MCDRERERERERETTQCWLYCISRWGIGVVVAWRDLVEFFPSVLCVSV